MTFVDMKPGDIVTLVTGGPQMTLTDAGENSVSREAECVWFDKDHVLHRESFPIAGLMHAIPDELHMRRTAP